MAKDSDKLRVLQRRKQELDHALKNGYSPEAVEIRAEKLRAAAVGVVKKHGGPFKTTGVFEFVSWETMRARWEALSTDEIITLSSGWGSQPRYRDVQIGNDKSIQEGEQVESGTASDGEDATAPPVSPPNVSPPTA